MILGIITTFLFLCICFQIIAKRMKWMKINGLFIKTHKITGVLFIFATLLHLTTSLSLYQTRPILLYITGGLNICLIIIVTLSYLFRNKLGKKWLTIHRIGTAFLFLLILIHIGLGLKSLIEYKKEVSNIEYNEISVTDLKDGVYEGEYDVGYIYAKVEVTAKAGRITDIEIVEHRNEKGISAEKITDRIIQEQKIDVDAISGATNSSQVIKKAVENALVKN